MKCPVDGATLAMTERSGVEIDYCPECRGVWLDRGELDKLITAGNASRGDYSDRTERDYSEHRDDHRDSHDDQRYDNRSHDQNQKRRRGSFLEDVFGGFGD